MGLPAKPIIDIDLTVPDSRDEAAYRPALEAAGFPVLSSASPGRRMYQPKSCQA